MANRNSWGLTWMQIKIFGCIILNETGIFRNNLVNRHLNGWVKIAISCFSPPL